jgi:hypothetical protein
VEAIWDQVTEEAGRRRTSWSVAAVCAVPASNDR